MHLAAREFDLIAKYFRRDKASRRDVKLGIGDDGAVLSLSGEVDLVVTTDTMVAGVHFDERLSPKAIGHKLIAVNLSDLAAMGAEPTWLSLALTLPDINESWLAEFSAGLLSLADYYHCSLIGGDVTRGPLTLTITAHGLVPEGRAIQRGGAQPGDRIYVSGTLGDARAALENESGSIEADSKHLAHFTERLHFPSPRVGLGQALRGVATSAIDLSDGLDSDIRHILAASKMGAKIFTEQLPASNALQETLPKAHERIGLQVFAGDDYELCFTVSEGRRGSLETISKQLGVPVTCIGVITKEPGLHYLYEDEPLQLSSDGFSHFGDTE